MIRQLVAVLLLWISRGLPRRLMVAEKAGRASRKGLVVEMSREKFNGKGKRNLSGLSQEGEYVLSEGGSVRSIKPYVHEFHSFAKGRWLGRELMEVLTLEFGAHSPQYWSDAIRNGFVRINGQRVSERYKFRNGDDFAHLTHRHEPPVMGSAVLIGETESLLAVCKPASMPMHPCGAYRFNSLTSVLQREPLIPQQPPLFLVHRLDRVTSGVVILAKSKAAAAQISQEISLHQTEKTYLARVKGRFPISDSDGRLTQLRRLEGQEMLSVARSFGGAEGNDDGEGAGDGAGEVVNINGMSSEEGPVKKARGEGTFSPPSPTTASATAATAISNSSSTAYMPLRPIASFEELCQDPTVGFGFAPQALPGWLLLRVPLRVVSHREGVHACDAAGKPSVSAFRGLGYCASSDTSLVECRPLTGRTHQLRLHLQFLGCPIANDPCYGGELFYGEPGKRAAARAAMQQLARLGLTPLSRVPHIEPDDGSDETQAQSQDQQNKEQTQIQALAQTQEPQAEGESIEHFLSRTCKYCQASSAAAAAAAAAVASSSALVAVEDGACDNKISSSSSSDSVLPTTAEGLERLLHCDGIWLHAQRYRMLPAPGAGSNGWSFTAPPPSWALLPGFKAWSGDV